MKNIFLLSITVLIATVSTMDFFQAKLWPVPDKANKTVNPIKSSAASIADGKTLWIQHCASCHGKTGLGDGKKAAQLETPVGDFSAAAFQKQSDGSLFYKVAEGRDDMPAFKKKLPEQEDIWNLVVFMRSLKK